MFPARSTHTPASLAIAVRPVMEVPYCFSALASAAVSANSLIIESTVISCFSATLACSSEMRAIILARVASQMLGLYVPTRAPWYPNPDNAVDLGFQPGGFANVELV